MKEYYVTITETFRMKLDVEAKSKEEAIKKVKDGWKYGEYTLDTDHFEDAIFEVEEITSNAEEQEDEERA